MFKRMENYNKQSSFFPGVKQFLAILNNHPAIHTLKNLNGHNKTAPIACFDFSTFYTNILHEKFTKMLKEHKKFVLKVFIVIDKYGSQWSNI